MSNKYAYITLLYPNKDGICTYLDGALLMASGLRKQNTVYPIICMVTPDVTENVRIELKKLYDEIIEVEYITPVKSKKGITIINEIFTPTDYKDENTYSDICHVFTKLHIFNKKIFQYDKLLFVDTDIIPISDYDSLFDLSTPAGWVEQIAELIYDVPDTTYTRIWGKWKIQHGQDIPQELTDIYVAPGSCVNAGLLLIQPDTDTFETFISQLQTDKKEWFGLNFKHKGCIEPSGLFVDRYYCPEQCFLTQHFSGQWKMIDGLYASWGYNEGMMGLHMAGLYYCIDNKKNICKCYKSWNIQNAGGDGFSDTTNTTAIWCINKHPSLKHVLMKNLRFRFFVDNDYIIEPIKKIYMMPNYYSTLNESQKELLQVLFS